MANLSTIQIDITQTETTSLVLLVMVVLHQISGQDKIADLPLLGPGLLLLLFVDSSKPPYSWPTWKRRQYFLLSSTSVLGIQSLSERVSSRNWHWLQQIHNSTNRIACDTALECNFCFHLKSERGDTSILRQSLLSAQASVEAQWLGCWGQIEFLQTLIFQLSILFI